MTDLFCTPAKVTVNVTPEGGDCGSTSGKEGLQFLERVAEILSGSAMKVAQCTALTVKPVRLRLQVTLRLVLNLLL